MINPLELVHVIINNDNVGNALSEGYVDATQHSTYPVLAAFQYSPYTVVKGIWNTLTASMTGLVMDVEQGEIVAKTPVKAFLWEQVDPKLLGKSIKTISDFPDGCQIILFFWQDNWILSSPSGFDGPEVLDAVNCLDSADLNVLDKKYTYVFQLVGPVGSAIDKAQPQRLYLMDAISVTDSSYLQQETLADIAEKINVSMPKQFDVDTWNYRQFKTGNINQVRIQYLNGLRVVCRSKTYTQQLRENSDFVHVSDIIKFWDIVQKVPLNEALTAVTVSEDFAPTLNILLTIWSEKYKEQWNSMSTLLMDAIIEVDLGESRKRVQSQFKALSGYFDILFKYPAVSFQTVMDQCEELFKYEFFVGMQSDEGKKNAIVHVNRTL